MSDNNFQDFSSSNTELLVQQMVLTAIRDLVYSKNHLPSFASLLTYLAERDLDICVDMIKSEYDKFAYLYYRN